MFRHHAGFPRLELVRNCVRLASVYVDKGEFAVAHHLLAAGEAIAAQAADAQARRQTGSWWHFLRLTACDVFMARTLGATKQPCGTMPLTQEQPNYRAITVVLITQISVSRPDIRA